MTYVLSLDNLNGIVSVIYSGTVDLYERLQAVSEVCEKFSHLAPLHILVDVKGAKNGMTPAEQKDFGQFLSRQYQLKHARVAVLHSVEFNPNATINATASSKGYSVQEFTSEIEALAWLNDA